MCPHRAVLHKKEMNPTLTSEELSLQGFGATSCIQHLDLLQWDNRGCYLPG